MKQRLNSKKPKTFFQTVLEWMKKHPAITFWMVILTIISSVFSIFGPTIIQNMMSGLMAPMAITQLIFMNPGDWLSAIEGGVISAESINYLIAEADFFYTGGLVSITSVNPDAMLNELIDALSSDSRLFATTIMGFNLNWVHWIYVQLIFFGIVGITTYLTQIISGLMGKRIEINLRNNALTKLVHQDMSYYSDKKIGEILTKIVSDTQIVGDNSAFIPSSILSAFITFWGSIVILFFIDIWLTVVVLGLMISLLIIIGGFFGAVRKLTFKVRESITEINGDVTDRISTVRLIKASGTENYEINRFVDLHKDYFTKSKKMITVQSVMVTLFVAGISSITMAIVIAAALLYNDDAVFLAVTLSAFISGTGAMIGPMMQVAGIVSGLIQSSTSAARIDEIIKPEPRFDPHYDPSQGVVINDVKGNIKFEGVEFIYPEKPNEVILPKFDFTFEHGKSYAFVGETGAGKSTIAKLLLRFYDPSQGRVLINGTTDLKDIYLASYLDKVGYVEQEPQILFGTVLENIRYGRFNATLEEVIEAAKAAELHDLIMSWTDGYDTILGERGFMLSGGQKQRLVIARMILKDPQLLILDEATSALDNIVEAEIQLKLNALMQGRTTISIAHRLSTIKNCDQVIVLARGKGLAQVGTFDELKKHPGHFKVLYEAGLMK